MPYSDSDHHTSTVFSGEPPNLPEPQPDPSATFPWHALPLHLQEQILSRLPVSALLRLLPVSRHFLSLLRSPPFLSLLRRSLPHRLDAFFLLSPALAYHPLTSRFVSLPRPASLSAPLASSPSLLITPSAAVRPFSASDPHPIPPMLPTSPRPYLLSVLHDPSDSTHFTLVAASTGDRLRSQVFDSRAGHWAPRGELPVRFAVLGNAVPMDRRLFVLSRGPDKVLVFQPETGHWEVLDAAFPAVVASAHLFVFEKRLFLVAGIEMFGMVVRIAVWQMDWWGRKWIEICAMPKALLCEFVVHPGRCYHFQAADRMGLVCLYNAAESQLVMFDAEELAWIQLPRPSGVSAEDSRCWFGHVVEPSIDLLMPPTS